MFVKLALRLDLLGGSVGDGRVDLLAILEPSSDGGSSVKHITKKSVDEGRVKSELHSKKNKPVVSGVGGLLVGGSHSDDLGVDGARDAVLDLVVELGKDVF